MIYLIGNVTIKYNKSLLEMSQKMIIFIGNVTIKVISENKLKRLSQFPIIFSLDLIISQFIEWAKMIISVQSTSFIYYFILLM